MKIILKEKTENLGSLGDIVTVKYGKDMAYAEIVNP
jgi:ribosomal protein L9